jgi:imidazolonepropionase-like amidohydrolase
MRATRLRISILLVAAAACAFGAEHESLLIKNVTIHPVTSSPATSAEIKGGSVLIVDGKIAEIGTKISAKGVKIFDGKGMDLYPGLINAGSNVGLSEISSIRDTIDLDEIGIFNPQLKAEVAFNPSSEHVEIVRAAGITTVLSLPSAGGGGGFGQAADRPIIPGQAALMHLDGWTWEEMALKRGAALDMLFPSIPNVPRQLQTLLGTPQRTYADLEREYKVKLEQMGNFFEDARRYEKAKAAGGPDFRPDPKLEAMIPVIDGKRPILVRAEKERAIKDAVEFADKEKVKIIIGDPHELGSTAELLAKHGIPVVLGKTLTLPAKEDDAYDSQYALPAQLFKAGVKFCFASFDVEFARNVPFEAAAAVAFGLPQQEALKGMTMNAAEIFGVADQIGSIEKGKLADLILTDGDPLEAKTSIKAEFIAGKPVSLESHHTRLYEKWKDRP